jgi:hypothetical protein
MKKKYYYILILLIFLGLVSLACYYFITRNSQIVISIRKHDGGDSKNSIGIKKSSDVQKNPEYSKQKGDTQEQIIRRQLITDSREFASKYHLVKGSLNCVSSQIEGDEDFSETVTLITFRELHGQMNAEDCGGDVSTSPRLFFVLLDRLTGEISTDAQSETLTIKKFKLDSNERAALTLTLPALRAKLLYFLGKFNKSGSINENDFDIFNSYYWVYARRVPEDGKLDSLISSTTTDFTKAWDNLGPCFGIPDGQCRE